MELIGIPHRITVGRGVENGILEWVDRNSSEKKEVALEDVEAMISAIYE